MSPCSATRVPAAGRSSSYGRLYGTTGRNAFPGAEKRSRLVSAVGSGGYHFWSHPDDDAHPDRHADRHEASEARKWDGRRQLEAIHRERMWQTLNPSLNRTAEPNARPTYDINGKVFSLGKNTAPPPEQDNNHHWLCQVNGMTGKYNIVNNLPEDVAITRKRDDEVRKIRERNKAQAMAGEVQPQRPIACYEMRSFVPIKHHHHMGKEERHSTLFS